MEWLRTGKMENDLENVPAKPAEPDEFAPRQSLAHALLRNEAEANRLDPNRVRELLWLLNAHPDIEEVAKVLANLAEILNCAEQQWPGILDLQHFTWIPDLVSELLKVVLGPPVVKFERQHAGGGDWLKRNALYGALDAETRFDPAHQERFRLLQAHYFFAHATWLIRNRKHPIFSTDLSAYESYGGPRCGQL